jgi:O-antigen/teichoic acid export membrane protein
MLINNQKNQFDNQHSRNELKKNSLRGGAVTVTSQGLMTLIQLGSTMILARILTPQDYGMLAMVVTVTGFAAVLNNLGLTFATVQRKEINHQQVSALFWINAAFGGFVALIVAMLSPVVAWFYKTPELVWMMLALSSNFFINGLAAQHSALLTRQMRFYTLAKVQILAMIIGIMVAIVAATHGFGYWALVLNSITMTVVSVVGYWIASGWIPALPKRNNDVKSMVKFGTDIVGFNIINYFSRNFDNILIGRFCGSTSLGYYDKAYQLLMMPIMNLRDPMTQVAMPALSKLQDDKEQYRSYYVKYISIIAFITMPLVVFMYACSDQLIYVLLGPQWLEVSDIFKILAIAALIQPVSTTWGLILLSMGRSKRYLKLGMVNSLITVAAFAVGLPWGTKGVASAYAVVTYLLVYPTFLYAFKDTPVKFIDLLMAIYKPLAAGLIMGLVCTSVLELMGGLTSILILMVCSVVCLFIYGLAFVLFSSGRQSLREYYSYLRIIFVK